ncbi:hypothetical protein [uncultured Anaerococcus sp.]|uniref:hypothetical protein n=1 Tax=uncultured Anaerococcus sp. TaxID=293428 RepID=UPI0026220243|nr:hypothetical protein [uncultured Anaerococcus sp.]
MEGILITIGLIAIGLSGIILTLIQLVQGRLRKENINRKKQLIIFLVIFVLGLALFLNPFNNSEFKFLNQETEEITSKSNENETKKDKTNNKEKLKSIKLVTKLKKENITDQNKLSNNAEEKVNKKELRATALAEIEYSFKDLCDITTKDEGDIFFIRLHPKDELAEEISQLMMDSQNQDLRDEWKIITDGVILISEEYYNIIGENVSISILNPLNEDNIIFTTFNGEEYYNVIDDLN